MKFSSQLLNDLNDRGFLYQFTDVEAMDKLFCSGEQIVLYIGFDSTAKSLHVGHLLWIKLVNKLQSAGHKPIVLCGGATSKIGDPTWKDKQRVALNEALILENTESIMGKLRQLINFDEGNNKAVLVNNDDWLSRLGYMEFLRDFGPLFSVNKMLTMDSVSARLERQQHLSFLEFNYMLLQAYDFLYLFENYGCRIQVGGADQWSNMISGVDLIRRKADGQAFGMSIPLLTTSSGTKMGKTEGGTVWLNQDMTSPLDFWQYWRNVDDQDVPKLLKLFTDMEPAEVTKKERLIGTKEINELKIVLADAVTNFVHPDADLDRIKDMALGIFDDSSEANTITLDTPMQLDDVLVKAGLSESKTAAKRLIEGAGVKIDDVTATSYSQVIDRKVVITVGKKRFVQVIVE
ncbi:MAG: tyrosine--tRNA ligase [Holosporales bacterium]|jgi:tyrosyl-tRNA synthetase|nr:tyrosine--tRNA ligase [Holosporales bacterium]